MFETIYQTLESIGYTHPVHPVFTHLTLGMTMGAFIFGIVSWILGNPAIAKTARYCIVLAIVAIIPTAIFGYSDWNRFYGGAWIAPIRWKLILSPSLFVLLAIAWLSGRKTENTSFGSVIVYFICLAIAMPIGYFGGELVYGKQEEKPAQEQVPDEQVLKGEELFRKNCLLCHHVDSTETKIGPGLKGIFDRETLPASQRPVDETNVRASITDPFKNMPAFDELTQEEIDALVAYMKTL
jgi:uncharacterized membrane protein